MRDAKLRINCMHFFGKKQSKSHGGLRSAATDGGRDGR